MRQLSSTPRDADPKRLAEDLSNLLGLARRGWFYLAAGAALGLTLAAVYLARAQVVHRASTRLLVLQQQARPLGPAADAVRGDEGADHLATHQLIIKSPLVVRRAIEALGEKGSGLSVGGVIGSLAVTRPDPAAKVLQLEYTSGSRELAEQVAEAVSQSYRAFLEENFQEKSHDVVAMMSRARDTLSVELREMEAKYLESRRAAATPALDATGQPLASRRVEQWEQELAAATMRAFRLRMQVELGRELAAEGAGLAALSRAISQLGGEGGSGADEGGRGSSPLQRLAGELAEVEYRRQTAERLLEHLQAEADARAASRQVGEDEIVRAFYSEPAAAALRKDLEDAAAKLDALGRAVRQGTDPAVARARRQVEALKGQLSALWARRAPELRTALAQEAAEGPGRESLDRAEAELVALRATERALIDRLDQERAREAERLGRDRDAMAARLGEDHPSVRELETRRAEVVANTGAVATSERESARVREYLRGLERDLAAAERLRDELRARVDGDVASAREAEYALLADSNRRNELERHRALYQSIVDQLKQAQLARDLGSTTAQVINPVAVSAVRPPALIVLAMALLGGLAAGGALAWVSDQLDGRLRSLGEIRRTLDLAVLGTIPRQSLPRGPDGERPAIGTITHAVPRSLIAESYRAIRTNLEFLRRHRQVQIILVCSPNPGDGKSTTASNLAISLAHAGRNVLLVDADLRRPTLHTLHGGQGDCGLADVLRGEATPGSVIRPTPVPGLDFLPAGAAPPDPAELLASSRFNSFLDEVRRAHDVVIIDSSPLLAVTDASIIGALADGILLVVNAAAVRRVDADRANELLRALGTPVLGVVVNATTREHGGHGYGYGYSYGYGNGYGYGYGEVYGSGPYPDSSPGVAVPPPSHANPPAAPRIVEAG